MCRNRDTDVGWHGNSERRCPAACNSLNHIGGHHPNNDWIVFIEYRGAARTSLLHDIYGESVWIVNRKRENATYYSTPDKRNHLIQLIHNCKWCISHREACSRNQSARTDVEFLAGECEKG